MEKQLFVKFAHLIEKDNDIPDYKKEDLPRIMGLCNRKGVSLSHEDAVDLWDGVSSSRDAGWLFLPDSDDELWGIIVDYVNEFAEHMGY